MTLETPKVSELWIELTKDTYHSTHFLRKMDEVSLSKMRGFRSMYMFPKDAVDFMMKNDSVGGITRYPVYSDTLFVDFDSGDGSSEAFEAILQSQKYAYTLYNSGKKGVHFHVPIDPMFHTDVPHSQRIWMASLGLASVDLSIYRHTGLFRLPGTIHKDTGRKKEMVRESLGLRLSIPIVPRNVSDITIETYGGSTFAQALQNALRSFIDDPGPGNRHMRLVQVAKGFIEAGISAEASEEIIRAVNAEWSNPKADDEISDCVRRAVRWSNANLNRP